MKNKWRKFQQLTTAEKILFGQALLLLPLNVTGLRLFGFKRWQRCLSITPKPKNQPAFAPRENFLLVQQYARIINLAAAHGVCTVSCLPRSLTLWWLLQRRQLTSELRVGVRKNAQNVEAHAWVEYAGVVINDRADIAIDFVPFAASLDFSSFS